MNSSFVVEACLYGKLKIPSAGGDITKEPLWTFNVDYVTRNNTSL